jgi:hypothetical protein
MSSVPSSIRVIKICLPWQTFRRHYDYGIFFDNHIYYTICSVSNCFHICISILYLFRGEIPSSGSGNLILDASVLALSSSLSTHISLLDYVWFCSFIIVSRVTVTKMHVWFGESVYWIFTSCNYK